MKSQKSISFTFFILLAILFGQLASPQSAHAAGTTRYVSSIGLSSGTCNNWANACTLQQALSIAVFGDELWVKQGTYVPTAPAGRDATFTLIDGVAVYGGFSGTESLLTDRNPAIYVTTMSGEIGLVGTADNSYHVVTITGSISQTYVLDGFTITAGNEDAGSGLGGGIYVADTSPAFANLIISNNSANQSGGGVFVVSTTAVQTDYSKPTFTNVTFSNNTAQRGGGILLQNASPTFTNVTFTSNTASSGAGGGLNIQTLNLATDPANILTLTDVTFSGNTATGGGGLYLSNTSGNLKQITFSNNSATRRGGGMLLEASDSPTLTNATFSGNTSSNIGSDPRGGGGLMVINSSPTLNNVTFSGNTSSANSVNGGALRSVRDITISSALSNPVIRNSIFWSDNTTEITSDGTGTITVSDSVVQGGFGGGTNIINTDPVLSALAANGGLTQTMALGSGSSAVDKGGVNTACSGADQRGAARVGNCDIGAYVYFIFFLYCCIYVLYSFLLLYLCFILL